MAEKKYNVIGSKLLEALIEESKAIRRKERIWSVIVNGGLIIASIAIYYHLRQIKPIKPFKSAIPKKIHTGIAEFDMSTLYA